MAHADHARERAGLHRFFIAAASVQGDHVTFTPAQRKQLRSVLRLGEGDTVVVLPGDGSELVVTLRLGADGFAGVILSRHPGIPEPSRQVWLYQSALRGDRFAWLLQKATELGAAGIVPVIYRYTQPADYTARSDRYRTIALEAAEQCRRSAAPIVLPALGFAEAVKHGRAIPASHLLLLDEQETSLSLRKALPERADATVGLFIGPEGGLSAEERHAAFRADVLAVTMGRRILRSETAGLAALTIALAAAGELD